MSSSLSTNPPSLATHRVLLDQLGHQAPGNTTEQVLSRELTQNEKGLAFLRAGFSSTVFVLFLLNNWADEENLLPRVLLESGAAALSIGFSWWVIATARKRNLVARDLLVSVSMDAILCTCGLLAANIAPDVDYPGALGALDISAVFVVLFATVLRFNSGAVVLSALLHVLGVTLVIWTDSIHGIDFDASKLYLLLAYLLASAALCLVASRRVRQLIETVTSTAVRAERARSSMLSLLQDNHDLCSILFDIQLTVDRMSEVEIESPQLSRLSQKVSRRLLEFSCSFEKSRLRAINSLRGLELPITANVLDAIGMFQSQELERGISLKLELPPSLPLVVHSGGTDGLNLLLQHLVSNSVSGNGRRGATEVRITCSVDEGNVILELKDDGPGFSPRQLEVLGREHVPVPRKDGTGMGLWLAGRALEVVGGSLTLKNGESGGARVVLRLPLATKNKTPPSGSWRH